MPEFERLSCPIRIGVTGDTHLVSERRSLPVDMLDAFSTCDLIFHTGDVNRRWVLDALEEIASVRAVYGNNDALDLLRELPFERYFAVGHHRLALIHGHVDPPARAMTAKRFVADRMRGVVDCVIYGHSHQPEIATRDGLLMVNPGSPTQPRWAPSATYAIVDIGDAIEPRLERVRR